MKSQAKPLFGRTESIVIPFPGQPTDVSSASPQDTPPDTTGRIYTFKEAAELLQCGDESTLRNRYWKEKVEPAFRHCPQPLRTIVSYDRNEKPVYRLNQVGLEVLRAYLKAKSEGRENDFLMAARQQYPTPTVTPEIPVTPTEVLPSESDRPSGMSVYQRSDTLTALLNARPQIDSTSTPEQNPLVLALQQKVAAMTTNTINVRQQLEQVRQMTRDTRDTIQALEDLAVVERAQAKADRHYQLEQQVYARRLEALGVEDVLGKPQSADA